MGQIFSNFKEPYIPNYIDILGEQLSHFFIGDICGIIEEYVGIICNKCEHIKKKLLSIQQTTFNIEYYQYNVPYRIRLVLFDNDNYHKLSLFKVINKFRRHLIDWDEIIHSSTFLKIEELIYMICHNPSQTYIEYIVEKDHLKKEKHIDRDIPEKFEIDIARALQETYKYLLNY